MKKLYNNPQCEILLLKSDDIMKLSTEAEYDGQNVRNAWDWSLDI